MKTVDVAIRHRAIKRWLRDDDIALADFKLPELARKALVEEFERLEDILKGNEDKEPALAGPTVSDDPDDPERR